MTDVSTVELQRLVLAALFTGGGFAAIWGSIKAAASWWAKRQEQRERDNRTDAKDWGKEYKSLYEEAKRQLDKANPVLEELRARAFVAEERAHKLGLQAAELQRRFDELMENNSRLSKLLEEKEAMLRSRKPKTSVS